MLKSKLEQDSETHSQTHIHDHAHHASSPSPGEIAERLLELKHSNPELFTQAWRRIPQTTQDNILSYLNKHKMENLLAPAAASSTYEDKNPHPHKHKDKEEALHPPSLHKVDDRITEPRKDNMTRVVSEKVEPRLLAGRPLFEWTDGELLAHTMLESETRVGEEAAFPTKGDKTELFVAAELQRISRQNRIQIVQNELIRRLLQTIAGKS